MSKKQCKSHNAVVKAMQFCWDDDASLKGAVVKVNDEQKAMQIKAKNDENHIMQL